MMESLLNDRASDAKAIRENIRAIRERMAEAAVKAGRDPGEIQLMAVTKTVPASRVNLALQEGVRLLGENRVQECCEKYQNYACGANAIHFIGHLQTNKIRDIIDKVGMIESVDSIRLSAALQAECEKLEKSLDILLQVNIGAEETKSGFLPEALLPAAKEIRERFPSLKIRGLMTVPPRAEGDYWLQKTRELFEKMKDSSPEGHEPAVLSMGMSEDFEAAIGCGSTQVRIGRGIFGERK